MNTNFKWSIVTLALMAATAGGTWYVAKHNQPATTSNDGDNPAKDDSAKKEDKKEDTVKLVMVIAKSLVQVATQARPSVLARMVDQTELRTEKGKKIEVERITMTSPEMIDAMLHGTLKAHIIIPADDVYLDLLDREWVLRTGKPLTAERTVYARQPYVIAVRRARAEAMGWPKKEIGWEEVVEVARDGWKVAGKPEWGPLKMLLGNPSYSDTGAHAVVSLARGILRKDKDLTPADLRDPKFTSAIKALDSAVVWYPSTIDDLVRNEALTVPARCDMTFLPEHYLLELNDRSARRKAPPDWVAIYPTDATIVDGITAAIVQREWVTEDHRQAASAIFKKVTHLDAQRKLMTVGYRPALPTIELGAPLSAEYGIDPKSPKRVLDMPEVGTVLDCLAAWDANWEARDSNPADPGAPAIKPSTAVPTSLKKLAHLTPTIQCVRRAKPCTISIRDGKRQGTGVVIDPRGYAITNSHVVGKAKTLQVTFLDEPDKTYVGTVVANDPNSDLALIFLDTSTHPAIKFSDTPGLEVGESVVVIGNPLGYTGTVSVGIVSAMGREIPLPTGETLKNVIQTNASINPGNSGGPLLDLDGELIGIVFAVRDGAQNIGFAIPLERVRGFIQDYIPKAGKGK